MRTHHRLTLACRNALLAGNVTNLSETAVLNAVAGFEPDSNTLIFFKKGWQVISRRHTMACHTGANVVPAHACGDVLCFPQAAQTLPEASRAA